MLLWSDNGRNFVGAAWRLQDLAEFLDNRGNQSFIVDFCTTQCIKWNLSQREHPILEGCSEEYETSPASHCLTQQAYFEEYSTVLSQIETCLNSRPLVPMPHKDDGVKVLTPGHFLIGRPTEALPDTAFSYSKMTLLRLWHLCQALIRQFWQCLSDEYISTLRHSNSGYY